ncbi:MAG: glutamate ABC transporter substrate-binding protein [Gordonia sp. (in: high G+C Gram-positive bacteria)]
MTIALLGILTLAGCVVFPAPDSPAPSAQALAPTPPDAATNVPKENPPNSASCNAEASLRPTPTQPEPRKMPPRTTMAAIAARGRLIVGLDIGSNLFSFRDPITGDIQGFDVDLAREIARAIFGDPNRIEYRVLSADGRAQALRNQEVDVVVKTMSITCDRLRDNSFSAPYYVASQRILVLRGSGITGPAQLAGKRVCAARGSTAIGRMQSIQPRAKMVTTTTWADCLVMLQQEQVDVVSTDDAILAGLASQDPWVTVVGPALGEEYYGVGIPLGHNDMVRFVNGILQQLRESGRWQEIYNRWLSILGPGNGPPQPIYRD